MDCTIVGDSIAVGISHFYAECRVDARLGRTATQQGRVAPSLGGALIISLGSNDGNALDPEQLHRIRRSARGYSYVFWVVPNRPSHARRVVQQVAAHYGDMTLDVRPVVSSDGVHPSWSGYSQLAAAARKR